ncbi:hypothetical protein DM01DRAFT_1403493 [Hesseltinella vesiculosa]|uniref:CHY-type domain-containing protein n=1 Tax=Hesseltinella vesiculosa TaxID=101127 RepID=A0A1X2GYM5_9FUNG|nr:hypothetical protein DM01DRAFT_1403493 [Hesseltinella vesiculosa]
MQSRQPVLKPKDNGSRQVQLDQLHKRYSSTFKKISDHASVGTTVRFALKPSDPDFPFDLENLLIQLVVPPQYPKQQCTLTIMNPDIPKGFALNVERGFHEQVSLVDMTLVRQFGWLDRRLESLLQEPATAVVAPPTKIMAPAIPDHVIQAVKAATSVSSSASGTLAVPPVAKAKPPKKKPSLPTNLASAFGQRSREMDHLKTRFGKDYRPSKSDRSLVHLTLVLNDPDFTRKDVFPDNVVRVRYFIPLQYPNSPCAIELDTKTVDKQISTHVATLFAQHVNQDPDSSLFEHLNWLSRHMECILNTPMAQPVTESKMTPLLHHIRSPANLASTSAATLSKSPLVKKSLFADDRDTKNRLIIIHDNTPVPFTASTSASGTASQPNQQSISCDEGTSSDATSTDDDAADEPSSSQPMMMTDSKDVRRGTEVRLLDPQLDNVTLLRCTLLHLLVKCNRCKNTVDVENVQPTQEDIDGDKKTRWLTCSTCQSVLGVKFLPSMVHDHASAMGFLQLAGCVAFDLLPSAFMAACAECLQDIDQGLRLAPHDRPLTQGCRHCHAKYTIHLRDYRFVALGAGGERLHADASVVSKLQMKRKTKKDDLQLIVGQALPNQGTCKHYGKSKRWFRFPCCHKLYACDVCHDKEQDHVADTAFRQVCGVCSKEQSIIGGRPCVHCGHEFERSLGKGAFWEGGQGTRSKQLMSRNDPHKHKGIGKTTSKKQDRVGLSGKQNRDKPNDHPEA